MNIKCFLIEETGRTDRYFRRFVYSDRPGSRCTSDYGYHQAFVLIGKGEKGESRTSSDRDLDKTDPRWPIACECGYVFKPEDQYQLFIEEEYVRADNPEILFNLKNAPVGAVWRTAWYEERQSMRGIDGKSYHVRTPGGDWCIDSVASNCTRKDDTVHKCWCRHGEPPNFTVNKVGDSCAAGGGSIIMREYHGMLIDGELTNC